MSRHIEPPRRPGRLQPETGGASWAMLAILIGLLLFWSLAAIGAGTVAGYVAPHASGCTQPEGQP